jgi:hypothetical protein
MPKRIKLDPDDMIFVLCPHCQARIWGLPADIDSGLRKHLEYCDKKPDVGDTDE